MLDEPKRFTLEDVQEFSTWTYAWYDHAIAMNFVHPPYHPDDTTICRLRGYFDAGLSPTEAAEACFGRKH